MAWRWLQQVYGQWMGFDPAVGEREPSTLFATGGLAEPLRLENPTRIVPGDRVTHMVYDVCTG
jgi:hypothetical protein